MLHTVAQQGYPTCGPELLFTKCR